MHHFTLGIWMIGACFLGADPGRAEAQDDIYAANKKLGRGINIGNALEAPNEGEWGVTLKAEFFQEIKKAGLTTVRLPINWAAHAEAEAPYTISPKFAERVDWAVDQALANQLNIIVNVHHYGKMDADPDKHLPRLIGLWDQISLRYKDRPARVIFELLNEPHDKLIDGKWNAAIPALLKAVRKLNPVRPVIVGPAQWNAIWALDKLELPKDDRHLILTVHFYDPFQFTHQALRGPRERTSGRAENGRETTARKTPSGNNSTRRRHGPRNMTGRFSSASSGRMRLRTWTRGPAGQALSSAKRNNAALAGPTGSSVPVSVPTIKRPGHGASHSSLPW